MVQFEKMGLPEELRGRFNSFIVTAFDDSLTVEMQMRSMLKWIKLNVDLTNEMVDYLNNFIETFDEKLYDTVEKVLEKWLKDGVLEELVNRVLLKINNLYVDISKYATSGLVIDDGVFDVTEIVKTASTKGELLYFPKLTKGIYYLTELPSNKCLGLGSTLKFLNPDWVESNPSNDDSICFCEYPCDNTSECGKYYFMHLDDKALEVNSIWQKYIILNNTTLGINAGFHLTREGYGNVAVGNNALRYAKKDSVKNIAIGHNAISSGKNIYQNTVVGTDSARDSEMMERNTFVGSNTAITTGSRDLVGKHHFYRDEVDTTYMDKLWSSWRNYVGQKNNPQIVPNERAEARGNVFLGRNSGGWTIVPQFNVAIGYNSLEKNIKAWRNTTIGTNAMYQTVKGDDNVSVGGYSLSNTSIAERNSLLGTGAMRDVAFATGNVAIGFQSFIGTAGLRGETNLTENNVIIGMFSLADHDNNAKANTTLGSESMRKRKKANYNVSIGFQSMYGDVTETISDGMTSDNVGVGRFTLANTPDGIKNNVALGSSSLRYAKGNDNTAVGMMSMNLMESGNFNTAIGSSALGRPTSGNNLTAIGHNALNNVSVNGLENSTGLGAESSITGSNMVQLGNSATTPYAFNALQLRSDIRDKKEIKDTDLGLEFLTKLKPVKYKWNIRPTSENADDGYTGSRFHEGLIAQDVEKVLKEMGVDFGGLQDHKVNGGSDVLSIGYGELITPIIKAIQELNEKIEKVVK